MAGEIRQRGFTLVEMAIVLVIIGLVLMAVFPALTAARQASQRATTQSNLHTLMLATAAYVQANGCVPCPATPGGMGTSFGLAAACGSCGNAIGIPPFASFGLPNAVAHDGWGHWITMRVDPFLTVKFTPTLPTGTTGLCQAGLSTTRRINVSVPNGANQKEAVLFISHGSSGYGSYFAQAGASSNNAYPLPFSGNYAACSASVGYAQCNSASSKYIVSTYNYATQYYDSPAYTGAGDSYDDLLTYADRNTLVALFGTFACQTVW